MRFFLATPDSQVYVALTTTPTSTPFTVGYDGDIILDTLVSSWAWVPIQPGGRALGASTARELWLAPCGL